MARYIDKKNLKLIGKTLRKHRETIGLSQSALEEITGFNINTIRNIENGNEFTMSYFLKICFTLNISPSHILDESKLSFNRDKYKLDSYSTRSITKAIHDLIKNGYFINYRKTKEVKEQLKEKFGIKINSKILAAILIRLVNESYLIKNKDGRLNIYKGVK